MGKTENDNRKTENSCSQETILESISDGVFTVDENWNITYFNRAAEDITGIPRSEALGRRCSDVFRSSICEGSCFLKKTMSSGKAVINKPCFIINSEGDKIPVTISTAALRNEDGKITGGAETFRDLSDIESLRKKLSESNTAGSMNSHSPLMHRIFDILPAVASSRSTVLIEGDTGTGKEVLARTIHSLGSDPDSPFIAVNCGALPDTLLESELFGYKRGAFTGASSDKPGRFALAGKGTIFLDEIGEISSALQVRLLRVLQEHTYEPLGSVKSEKTEARVIAATNRNLAELVKEGSFREDLFYRVNIIRIELPPLNKRKEDIPVFTENFIKKYNSIQGKSVEGAAPEVYSAFMLYDWPGNVRELENIIERAFVICPGGMIELRHIPDEIIGSSKNPVKKNDKNISISEIKNSAEKDLIINILEKHKGSLTAAAAELNIHRATLYRKIKKLNIRQ